MASVLSIGSVNALGLAYDMRQYPPANSRRNRGTATASASTACTAG